MAISSNEALECFRSEDLIGVGMEADAVRRRLHPEGVVSYAVDGLLECAGDHEARAVQAEAILDRSGTGAVLRGLHAEGRDLDAAVALVSGIKQSFPELWLQAGSVHEVLTLATRSGSTLETTLARLRDAGIESLAGEDAEILDDAVQTAAGRNGRTAEDWLRVHRAAHRTGMLTTASMRFGGGETLEHRVRHLERLRALQQETGGFTAFTPRAVEPLRAGIQGFEETTAVEYLKTLAICRMFLDTIPNLAGDLETQGLKILQMTLRFGGNDVGSVPPENADRAVAATEEQLRQVIRDAGFRPVQRDGAYRMLLLQ
ncbi:MAG: dehypoxanthine futalosine cyclase [Acidobacteriota bacterium]|nr:dehypoxanthine futalosine cyclase [Acidobacteriota bacterium]